MNRSTARPVRKPRAARETQGRAATHVFRDFVRQLEKLDARRAKVVRQGGR